MDQVSLYRKYRPHNFDNLVGQDHVKTTLMNAFKGGSIAHAYLFTGPRGTGKTSTARLIAKALNCVNLQENFEPCDECEFCQDINNARLIDLIEIDAASNRGIDEVRELKEKINFAPTRAKVKVYIIDEVHMMTKEAFNALLKTLEEPPAHAFFILATTEIHKIPETIISRCQRFDFRRISTKALMTRLSYICQLEEIEAEDNALEAISKYVDGGLRDAIGLVEQLTVEKKLKFEQVKEILGLSDFGVMDELLKALLNKDCKTGLALINELHNQGSDLKQFIHEFIDYLRNKMLENLANDNHDEVSKFLQMIEIFQEAQMKTNANIPQLSLEIAIIKLVGFDVREHQKIEPVKAKPLRKEVQPLEEELSLSSENWPRVVEKITSPSLRMSVKDAKVVKIDGSEIHLEFGTNFHKDKVMEHDHRVELELMLKETFGQSLKIVARVKELEIKSMVEEEKSQKENIIDEALNIFGGQVVD